MCECQMHGTTRHTENSNIVKTFALRKLAALRRANVGERWKESLRDIQVAAPRAFYTERRPQRCSNRSGLAQRVIFAQTLESFAQAPLQRRRRVGIERHQIPQGLTAILAQVSQRVGVRIGMPRYVLADRSVRMPSQFLQCFRVRTRKHCKNWD